MSDDDTPEPPPAEPSRSGDTVAILRTGDSLRARQIADLLQANGIPFMWPSARSTRAAATPRARRTA